VKTTQNLKNIYQSAGYDISNTVHIDQKHIKVYKRAIFKKLILYFVEI